MHLISRLSPERRSLAALLAVFVLLGAVYSVANPLFEAPDEVWHYEYARWLVEGRGLPRPEDVGTAPWRQEGSQPPLYYLAAAALTWPVPTDNAAQAIRYNPHAAMGQPGEPDNKNVLLHGAGLDWPWRGVALAGHLVRWFSVLLGAVTAACTWAIARTLHPDRGWLALLAAGLVAFNPQFIFISSAINNDNLVTALCAAALLLCVRLLFDPGPGARPAAGPAAFPRRALFLLGVACGAAALSKLTGLALAIPVLFVLVVRAVREGGWRRLLRESIVVAAPAAAIAGWWYVRNWILYGSPLGLSAMFDVLGARPAPPSAAESVERLEGVWRSMWGVFGWYNVPAADWVVAAFTVLTLLGLAGIAAAPLLRRRARRGGSPADASPRPSADRPASGAVASRALLGLWLAVMLAALYWWMQIAYPQGRLLFPGLPALAVILACGLHNWLRPASSRPATATLLGAMAVLALAAPFVWIVPAYRPAAAPAAPQGPDAPLAVYAGQVRLLAVDLPGGPVQTGDIAPVTLTWQAMQPLQDDYSVFVHLVDEQGLIQAQDDSYPGGGLRPTGEWAAGERVVDTHWVRIPQTAPAPAALEVRVGLYEYSTGRRLLAGDREDFAAGSVALTPRFDADGIPNPLALDFSGKVRLRGFDVDRVTLAPGEKVTLRLWWQGLAANAGELVVFVHLLLPPDAVWAGVDQSLPATVWPAGRRGLAPAVPESYTLQLPPAAPEGVYQIEIGVYDRASMKRLSVDWSDKGIVLRRVRVTAP